MTTNRLAGSSQAQARVAAPSEKGERERFWIERGNRVLWGEEATSKGIYIEPRRDLQWLCDNGSYFIGKRL